jgi:hypothetical protein
MYSWYFLKMLKMQRSQEQNFFKFKAKNLVSFLRFNFALEDQLVSFFSTSIMVSANKVALHASMHKRAAGACLDPQTPAGQLSC